MDLGYAQANEIPLSEYMLRKLAGGDPVITYANV